MTPIDVLLDIGLALYVLASAGAFVAIIWWLSGRAK